MLWTVSGFHNNCQKDAQCHMEHMHFDHFHVVKENAGYKLFIGGFIWAWLHWAWLRIMLIPDPGKFSSSLLGKLLKSCHWNKVLLAGNHTNHDTTLEKRVGFIKSTQEDFFHLNIKMAWHNSTNLYPLGPGVSSFFFSPPRLKVTVEIYVRSIRNLPTQNLTFHP